MLRQIPLWLVIILMIAGCSKLNPLPILFDPLTQQNMTIQGDPQRGKDLFTSGVGEAPPCSNCHHTASDATGYSIGPNLHDIATTAGERREGMTAGQYIENSIKHPAEFIVPGYRNSMFADYALYLSAQDIADIIAYLMSLSA